MGTARAERGRTCNFGLVPGVEEEMHPDAAIASAWRSAKTVRQPCATSTAGHHRVEFFSGFIIAQGM